MRVLYLTTESFLTGPIIQSQVVNLLERLAADPVVAAITLVTFEPTTAGAEERYHGSPKVRHVMRRDRGHARNLLWLARHVLAQRGAYDLLHVRSYPPMLAALPGRLLLGKRLVFDPRGLLAEELSYERPRRLLSFVFKRLERVFCRAADAVVAVSEPMRRYLLDRYGLDPRRVRTIPTFSSAYGAADGAAPAPDVRRALGWEGRVVFVYSGSMEQWQRLDDVVRFFALARGRLPDARLLVLSKQRDDFERYLGARLGAGDYAVLSAASKDLPAYLAQGDYGLLFRDDHLINRVSAPIKVKDYLIAGLPVVLTDHIGDSSAFVREHGCGVVLDGLSDEAMGAALDAVARRHGAWDRPAIVRRARAAFDVEAVAASYRDLYHSLR